MEVGANKAGGVHHHQAQVAIVASLARDPPSLARETRVQRDHQQALVVVMTFGDLHQAGMGTIIVVVVANLARVVVVVVVVGVDLERVARDHHHLVLMITG